MKYLQTIYRTYQLPFFCVIFDFFRWCLLLSGDQGAGLLGRGWAAVSKIFTGLDLDKHPWPQIYILKIPLIKCKECMAIYSNLVS
jgi:hypothetical protein